MGKTRPQVEIHIKRTLSKNYMHVKKRRMQTDVGRPDPTNKAVIMHCIGRVIFANRK